ncbi:MAG: DUF4978 domain-containing protein [Bacilli bacterium]
MNKICKSFLLLGEISVFLLGFSASSNNNEPKEIVIPVIDELKTTPVYDGNPIVVSEVATLDNGKTILKVDGKPFSMVGAQIRVDALMNTDKMSIEEIEPFFKASKELNVSVVQIPLEWKDIEIDENVWDFNYITKILEYTNKYDLKCEFLWFGTNMCGDTHSYTVPEYILKDGKTYPKLDANKTGEFWSYYGIQWFMDFDNPNLIEKESRAITKCLDYVYEYDSTHEGKKPLIGFQVLNEPDIFIRFRLFTKEVISRNTLTQMTDTEAWNKVLTALDAYGKAAKNSKYKVYTRVNLASSTGTDYNGYYGIWNGSSVKIPPEWARKIFELEGIDSVGDDSYTSSVADIKAISYMYGNNLPGNYSHIAENAGSYTNTGALILAAFSQGAGYNIYDLATPPFYISHGSASVDQGIYQYIDGELVPHAHKDEVQNIITGLRKAGSLAVTFNPGDFIGLNIAGSTPLDSVNQTIKSNKLTINFQTSNKGYGFAVNSSDELLVYVTEDSYISLSNCSISSVTTGYYDENNNFVKESDETTSSNVSLRKNTLYRFALSSTSSQSSNAWNYIG